MSSSPEAQVLIAKLSAVHQRAASGDREAVHFIKSLKTRAFSGDAWSRRVYNTLAVIHHRKKQGAAVYDKSEAYYLRLVQKEPTAMAKLQTLIQRVRAGDEDARRLFSVLRSVHGKHKSSAFTAAPPSFSGYGYQQRPGTIIGASQYGHGGGYPMNQNPYGLNHGFMVGAGPQPLTVQAVANLIGLMVRVRAMPLAAVFNPGSIFVHSSTRSAAFDPSNPQSFDHGASPGGGGGFTTVPQPSGLSTVPQPSGMSTVVPTVVKEEVFFPSGRVVLPTVSVRALARVGPPLTDAERAALLANQGICNTAAAALARNSPAAPGLMNQCSVSRRNNIMSGQYFADNLSPNDPGYRVALTDAGTVVVNANPQLKAFAQSLMAQDPTGARSRGFTMAMGVRAGKMDPKFPAFVRPGLSGDPNLIGGFDTGMSMQ